MTVTNCIFGDHIARLGPLRAKFVSMQDGAAAKPVREERRTARDEGEEVVPGILRIQLPISLPGLGHVNCYAMQDSKGIILVDPGLPGPRTYRALQTKMKSAGLPINRVHTVVVTHSHPDHFGQVGLLKKRFNVEVITHRSFRTFLDPQAEQDEQDLEIDSDPTQAAPARHQNVLGDTTPWGGARFQLPLHRKLGYWAIRKATGKFLATSEPTRTVDDNDVVELGGREWVAVHTPGHTKDHLCLWDSAGGVMISGDHVLPTITPHISGMGETSDPLADFFQSLERMKELPGVNTVLPAHGLDFSGLAKRAQDIQDHHLERLQILREASGDLGSGTVNDYMRRLFKERSWGSMAESETFAHLEHLRIAGEAQVSSDGPLLRYEFN